MLLAIVASMIPLVTYIDVVWWSLPLVLGSISMVVNLVPCCVRMKSSGLGITGVLLLLTTAACLACGIHVYQNVDDYRCSYEHYHYEDDYLIEEVFGEVDPAVGEKDVDVPGGDEIRRLEHTCGSWLWIAITMLVDGGLWFLSTILAVVFIVKYNKQSNGEGTSLPSNNNVGTSTVDPDIEEGEQSRVGL
jgi:hypothetical protein